MRQWLCPGFQLCASLQPLAQEVHGRDSFHPAPLWHRRFSRSRCPGRLCPLRRHVRHLPHPRPPRRRRSRHPTRPHHRPQLAHPHETQGVGVPNRRQHRRPWALSHKPTTTAAKPVSAVAASSIGHKSAAASSPHSDSAPKSSPPHCLHHWFRQRSSLAPLPLATPPPGGGGGGFPVGEGTWCDNCGGVSRSSRRASSSCETPGPGGVGPPFRCVSTNSEGSARLFRINSIFAPVPSSSLSSTALGVAGPYVPYTRSSVTPPVNLHARHARHFPQNAVQARVIRLDLQQLAGKLNACSLLRSHRKRTLRRVVQRHTLRQRQTRRCRRRRRRQSLRSARCRRNHGRQIRNRRRQSLPARGHARPAAKHQGTPPSSRPQPHRISYAS